MLSPKIDSATILLLSPSANVSVPLTAVKSPGALAVPLLVWRSTNPTIDLDSDVPIELPLTPLTTLQQPHEEPVAVSAMRFKCALDDLKVPKEPCLDAHVMKGLTSVVELHDEKGALLHSMRMGDIPLGFDETVVPGRFYELPHLCNRYYCEKIEGDLVTWTLVESYQHGQLFQATAKQKLEYSRYYVPVTDSKIKARLEAMLARFKSE